MAFNATLGQSLTGSQLQTIPPNASSNEQIALINQIIGVLNNFSRDVVASGPAVMTLVAQSAKVLTVSHMLGYIPQAFVYVSGTNPSLNGVSFPGSNVSLPTFIDASTSGGIINFDSWIDYFMDANNLYIRLTGAVNFTGTLTFQYYLTRNPAT